MKSLSIYLISEKTFSLLKYKLLSAPHFGKKVIQSSYNTLDKRIEESLLILGIARHVIHGFMFHGLHETHQSY